MNTPMVFRLRMNKKLVDSVTSTTFQRARSIFKATGHKGKGVVFWDDNNGVFQVKNVFL